ncbi:hypothetical protein ACTQ49_11570 [Luteococcus sp. Sow4_B9]|uniref:hypothetical protein n=1 Tax=Luteococcus sp. Sow4_B9 TaxID=3438792 RepID=UPI003F95CF6A
MSGDFPEEWFRPEQPDRPDRGEGTADPGAAEERWTDQFKPGYRPHNREETARGQSTPPPERDHAEPTPGPVFEGPARPSSASHSVGVAPSVDMIDDEPKERQHGFPVLMLAGTAVVALAVGSLGSQAWRQYREQRVAPPSASTASSVAPAPTATPWGGAVSTVKATGVIASCTAPPQPGYDGTMIPSEASRVLDGDRSTGWRCDGSGLTHTLAFTFAPGTKVVGVRLTNGYTKSVDGLELYPQYRRISEVSWSFPALDNAYFVQELADLHPALQEIRIPETNADGGMQLQITGSTQPGETQISRNAVIITEVEFLVRRS